ncbi:MAG: flagellar basal body P-ring protein FlgI [Gemmatimonadales bacterium]
MMPIRFRACPRARLILLAFGLSTGLASSAVAQQEARIGDLTVRQGVVPRRLVGYGLVMGLDGTGDRSFGTQSSSTMTVRSVVNLLRRFNIEVPPEQLRLRNVAAVLITAELSPYLRPGGRFEVQVAAMGDATSLRGGVLWITPLVADPDQAPLATAQGAIVVPTDGSGRISTRQGNAGRIADGGILEVDQPAVTLAGEPRLALRQPDLRTATRIAAAISAAFGAGTARADDPGSILLNPGAERADSLSAWLAAVDTLPVALSESPRIVIDGRDGTVVIGGEIRLGPATVSHRGITVQVGGDAPAAAQAADSAAGSSGAGLVRANPGSSVQTLVAGLHAAGARPPEVAAIFEALRAAGAVRADVIVR